MEKPLSENSMMSNPTLTRGKTNQDYATRVERRSRASARKYNNPFPNEVVEAIDWNSPEYAIMPDDPRWILPETFDLGAHEWYQTLPDNERIRIGMYRYAQVARVGSEFEEALISGIAIRNMWLPSDSVEKRYSTHEAEEEQRHILMFDEFVRRTGTNPKGAPDWFRKVSYMVGPVAKLAPVAFWAVVLAGEEPIDRTQRSLLDYAKKGGEIHPLIHRVMKVHVEEEARHISFADDFLREHADRMTPRQRRVMAKSMPFILRLAADVMLKPSKEAQADMDIPEWVAEETWFESEHGNETLQNLFVKTVPRLDDLNLIDTTSKIGKIGWRRSGIDLSRIQ